MSGARGSRFLRRRQQLQQLELHRASAPPHSLPAARAAARPNGPPTAAARAPPRRAPPRPAHVLPHCASRRSLRAPLRAAGPANFPLPPVTGRGLPPAARARAPAPGLLSVAARPAPCPLPTPSRRRGTVGCALRVPVRAAPLLGPGHGGNESAAAIGQTFPAMRQTGKSHCVVARGNLKCVAAWSG